ncbi:MAG: hypothetical protein ACW96S_10265, partial [Promethearchaeota archaeon]
MNKQTINNDLKINFIRIKKADGQHFIQIIKDHFKIGSIIDQKYKIFHEKENIFFPLVENNLIIERLINIIDKSIMFEIIPKKTVQRL